jgi:lipopolysaccharide/colanic/teichoic acid biosynthesis glycosyltransferase
MKMKPSTKRIVIKLNRVGFEGKIFRVYKLRTMYPYSEFIQKKVFELNQLDKTGKINHDFRITPHGRFLRKYWLDELPQLINWIKSDIKLVGIRGMSLHYFSLYPDNYQDAYLKVKPGLIPPIFDDSNSDFEAIQKEELKYLKNYCASPVRTDLNCFFTTFINIVFKNYRGR